MGGGGGGGGGVVVQWAVYSKNLDDHNDDILALVLMAKYPPVGRGQHSHAYTHSVQVGHRVWLNLETLKFYCLPDNYQIIDPSLEDIKVGRVRVQRSRFSDRCV